MSQRDEKGFLWDIVVHGRLALEFIGDASLDQYARALIVRSAVEREVAIVGEAYGGIDAIRPDLADRLPGHVHAVVGTRNILIHGYDSVDDEQIYRIVGEELAPLISSAQEILLELGGTPPPAE